MDRHPPSGFLVRTDWPVRVWRLRDAKARLSALIEAACEQGPQEITLRGRTVVVVVSKECFDRLMAQAPQGAGEGP